MRWAEFRDWYTLFPDTRLSGKALARLYTPGYAPWTPGWTAHTSKPWPKWTAVLAIADAADERIQLDPTLTLDEAKLVVQTLVGSRS